MSDAGVSGEPRGRTAVQHDGHVDYLDHGKLLHEEGGRTEEHRIPVSPRNPDRCDAAHRVQPEPGHVHGANCGHEAVPHGSHVDYLVNGRLQHPHGDHIDDHGALTIV